MEPFLMELAQQLTVKHNFLEEGLMTIQLKVDSTKLQILSIL